LEPRLNAAQHDKHNPLRLLPTLKFKPFLSRLDYTGRLAIKPAD
jgi:hypothetical protein